MGPPSLWHTYGSPATYPTRTFGNVTSLDQGTLVRPRVTDNNAASSSYTLSAERFILATP